MPTNNPETLAQPYEFGQMLKACLAVKNCISFTIWGFDDAESWVPGTFAGEGYADIGCGVCWLRRSPGTIDAGLGGPLAARRAAPVSGGASEGNRLLGTRGHGLPGPRPLMSAPGREGEVEGAVSALGGARRGALAGRHARDGDQLVVPRGRAATSGAPEPRWNRSSTQRGRGCPDPAGWRKRRPPCIRRACTTRWPGCRSSRQMAAVRPACATGNRPSASPSGHWSRTATLGRPAR